MKHQLDATLCRFYFCGVTLHVSGASAHHQEYLKLVQRPLVHVLSLQVSHHISLLGPELNAYREGIALKKNLHTNFVVQVGYCGSMPCCAMLCCEECPATDVHSVHRCVIHYTTRHAATIPNLYNEINM